MPHNPVGWFEIYVQDMPRAKAFYEGVFSRKLELLTSPDEADKAAGLEMWAFPMSYESFGAAGALVKMQGMSAGNNSVVIYFSSEDCAVEEARVERYGGRVQCPKMSIGQYGFISLAFDTEGNMFGIHSMR